MTLSPVAVVDWDQGTRGDPLFDFATLLSYWIHADDPWAMHDMEQMPAVEAVPVLAQEAVAAYARLSGRDMSNSCSTACSRCTNLSVIFLQLGMRYRSGRDAGAAVRAAGRDRHRHSGIHPRNRPRTRILMDVFSLSPELQELQQRTRAFIRDKIIPLEGDRRQTHHGPTEEFRRELVALAAAEGLVAPHVGIEYGGLGLSHVGKAMVFEEAGYSLLGPVAMHIFAPDEGNMHLLEAVAPGTEGAVAAAAGVRRDPVVLLHDGARPRCRLGPGGDEDHGGEGRQPLCHQRR